MIINLEVVSRDLLGPMKLTKAQVFHIYESTEVVIVSKDEDFIFTAFEVVAPSLKSFNNGYELLIMSLILSLCKDHFLREKGYQVLLANFWHGKIWICVDYMTRKCWSKVIWLRTLLIVYPKALVSIWIWHFGSKYLRIRVLVKAFYRYIKTFIVSKIRKSILELTFIKLALGKSNFLNLVNFDFFDLADFAAVDRFSKLLPTQLLPIPLPLLAGIFWFF